MDSFAGIENGNGPDEQIRLQHLPASISCSTIGGFLAHRGTGVLSTKYGKIEDINEMVNRFYPTSSFIDYKADVESPLPMIYQSGYLTIKDWNMDTDSYLLDFPNDEVRSGFLTLVKAAKRR